MERQIWQSHGVSGIWKWKSTFDWLTRLTPKKEVVELNIPHFGSL